jgi:hypothetical protein
VVVGIVVVDFVVNLVVDLADIVVVGIVGIVVDFVVGFVVVGEFVQCFGSWREMENILKKYLFEEPIINTREVNSPVYSLIGQWFQKNSLKFSGWENSSTTLQQLITPKFVDSTSRFS